MFEITPQPVIIDDNTPLTSIDPIEGYPNDTPKSREDLARIVEFPLLEACQILFDKKIKTVASSANKANKEGFSAYITIDYDNLTEENKIIGKKLGKFYHHDDGFLPATNSIILEIPVTKETTVGQVKNTALELVSKFEQQ